jgi:hypothetical protein
VILVQAIIEISKKAPEQFRPYIAGAAPIIAIIGQVVAALVPLFEFVSVLLYQCSDTDFLFR